tara:strand:+ start:157 stop:1182 length:1026 start_codon:yes stop_codon:yes gene_type:complete
MYHPFFKSPCDVPDISWFNNLELPIYKNAEVIGLCIKNVKDIKCKNDLGQIYNTGRQLGTDKENVSALTNSFLSKGINTNYLPPIIDENNKLYDGFSRQEFLLNINQDKYVYLVIKKNDDCDEEDLIDEVSLGSNNHDPSKPSSIHDFKQRLHKYVERKTKAGHIVSESEGIEWFARINHTFSVNSVKNAVQYVLNQKTCEESLESYSKKKAENLAKKEYHLDNSIAMTLKNSHKDLMSNGANGQRTFFEALRIFDETGFLPSVVVCCDKIPPNKIDEARSNCVKQIDQMNDLMESLVLAYKQAKTQNKKFKVLDVKGFLPQIVGKEKDFIPASVYKEKTE